MDPKRDGCYCPISPLHFQIGRYVMRGAERGLRGRRDVEASESLVHNPEEAGCSAAGDCNVMGPFTLAANSDVGTIYSRAEGASTPCSILLNGRCRCLDTPATTALVCVFAHMTVVFFLFMYYCSLPYHIKRVEAPVVVI